MKCLFCETEMQPLTLRVASPHFPYVKTFDSAVGGIMQPGVEQWWTGNEPLVCSGKICVCPKCGNLRMEIPEQVAEKIFNEVAQEESSR